MILFLFVPHGQYTTYVKTLSEGSTSSKVVPPRMGAESHKDDGAHLRAQKGLK